MCWKAEREREREQKNSTERRNWRDRKRRRMTRERVKLSVIEATLAAVSFLADRDGRKNERWTATRRWCEGIIDFQQAFDARKGGSERARGREERRAGGERGTEKKGERERERAVARAVAPRKKPAHGHLNLKTSGRNSALG